jgi:hypothetical protein
VLVKTSGRFYGAREGGGDRSWLLIKHKDDWAGDVDIAEFAPRSVKSDGDFEDILAAENPAIWHTNRPAKGGDTGKMFEKIIEKAAQLKAGRGHAKDIKKTKVTKKKAGSKAPSSKTNNAKAAKPAKKDK